jgi:hypothetical protein
MNALTSRLKCLIARWLALKRPILCAVTGHWYRKWHYRALYEQFWRTCERCGKVRKLDATSAEQQLSRFIANWGDPSSNKRLDPTVGLAGE